MNSLGRVAPFVRPYRRIAVLLVITTILPVAMELIVPRALRTVIDQGIRPGDMTAIGRGSGIMLLAAVVGAAATLGQGVFRATLSQGLAYDLRNKLFAHIQTFSFADLDHMQTGQLITRLSSDVDLVRMFASAGLALLLRALLMILGSLVMMVVIDWQLALIMLLLLPLAALFMRAVVRLAQPLFIDVQLKLGLLNTIVQENLAGAQVVKAFVREQHEIERFEVPNGAYQDQNIRVGRLLSLALPVLTLLTNLGIVAVLWFGGQSTVGGRLSVGELVAFNSYLMIGMAPLTLMGNILTMVSRAQASAARVWEVLDTVPTIQPPVMPHRPAAVRGEVAFDRVSFHYDGSDRRSKNGRGVQARTGGRNVLSDVSFTVKAGQRVALLGATGSGKSSLISLIPRFYESSQGQVCVDGVDVRSWEPETLRRHIGVVMQETTLFSGTVRENIAYGRPVADLEAVIAAAKAARAHDFIMAMPKGYDSMVEERGANLSGGQKQRIAIARALLIKPAILILDDSTSAVDLETEAEIQHALGMLGHKSTTFIIAQRISSVLSADQILVLEHGRIVAMGAHAELLATSPIYGEIYRSQLGDGQVPSVGGGGGR